MKKSWTLLLPFLIMPVFLPVYILLDGAVLVDIFGCGCVPDTQTNLLGIPFNANDLRLTVFSLLTLGMGILSILLSKKIKHSVIRMLYCTAAVLINLILTVWVCRTFLWA